MEQEKLCEGCCQAPTADVEPHVAQQLRDLRPDGCMPSADTQSLCGQLCSSSAGTPDSHGALKCADAQGPQIHCCSGPKQAKPPGLFSTFTRPVRKRTLCGITADNPYQECNKSDFSYPNVRIKLKTPDSRPILMQKDPVHTSHPVETGAPSLRKSQPIQRPRREKQLCGVKGAVAALQFPDLRSEQPLQLKLALEPAASRSLVAVPTPFEVANDQPLYSNPLISAEEVAEEVRTMQRDKNTGYWKTDLFFPGQHGKSIKDPLDHNSVRAALNYNCRSPRCSEGKCCQQLLELDVLELRQQYNNGSLLSSSSDAAKLLKVIDAARDERAKGGYGTVRLTLKNGKPVDVCLPSFALLAGYTGSAFKHALASTSTFLCLRPLYSI